jgi:hypothetical protein
MKPPLNFVDRFIKARALGNRWLTCPCGDKPRKLSDYNPRQSLHATNLYETPSVMIQEDDIKRIARFAVIEQDPLATLHSTHEPNSLNWVCLTRSYFSSSVPNSSIVNF